jgi:hypothetical protein
MSRPCREEKDENESSLVPTLIKVVLTRPAQLISKVSSISAMSSSDEKYCASLTYAFPLVALQP